MSVIVGGMYPYLVAGGGGGWQGGTPYDFRFDLIFFFYFCFACQLSGRISLDNTPTLLCIFFVENVCLKSGKMCQRPPPPPPHPPAERLFQGWRKAHQ